MAKDPRQGITLTEAATKFLGTLPQASARGGYQQEIYRFARWYGAEQPMAGITSHEIASYAESLGETLSDGAKKLEPIRAFLAFAKKEGITPTNLAVNLRLRKGGTKGRASAPAKEEEPVLLTKEGYAQLEEELAALKKGRPKIAEELRKARADKDFRENAPLDAAREHQGQVEARIRELEAILRRAEIVQEQEEVAKAQVGSTVILWDMAAGSGARYTLVYPNEVNIAQGRISVASPIGRAILNKAMGDTIEVAAPAGTMRFRIEAVE